MRATNESEYLKPARRSNEDGDAEFLLALGKRVRGIRERRGMARKMLVRDAGVSERYLAQLEGGEGNVSIILLRRIALALGVLQTTLLSDDDRSVGRRSTDGGCNR